MADIFDPNQIAFGRLEAPDERDANFPMALALEADAPLPRFKFWSARACLNQGNTSACVGFSWRHWLEAAPVMVRIGQGPTAPYLYQRAQDLDEFSGSEPTMHGSSVRGGAKAVLEAGGLTAYVWAQGIEDVKRFLLTEGPVVVGSSWTSGMMNPDSSNRLRVTGNVVGGHAWCVLGYSSTSRMFRMIQSWGSGWGMNGRAWIAEDDLAKLLAQGGECVAATAKELNA